MTEASDRPRRVCDAFDAVAAVRPEHPALIYLGERYTYRWLREAVGRFAGALRELGVGAGDRVLLAVANCPQWLVAYLGLQQVGAVPVPVAPTAVAAELEDAAVVSQAVAAICQDVNFGSVHALRDAAAIDRIVVVELVGVLPVWKRAYGRIFDRVPRGRVEYDHRTHRFTALLRAAPSKAAPTPSPAEPLAAILFTDGTTGPAHEAPLSHRALLSCIDDAAARLRPSLDPASDVVILVEPLFHVLSVAMFLACGLHAGCPTVVMPEPQTDATLEAIGRHRVTVLLGSPLLYRRLLRNERCDLYDLGSLRQCWSGGDVLSAQVFEQWQQRCGQPIRQVYGTAEVGLVAMADPNREPTPCGLGAPLPSRPVAIVDLESATRRVEGEAGELVVRSAEVGARDAVEIDGVTWFRTGDIVRAERGELCYVDRRVDSLQIAGQRFAAAELEAALQEHPAVFESCVVTAPTPAGGATIKAFVVVPQSGRGVTASELIDWCRVRLLPPDVPIAVEFRDILPKSRAGKLLRRELRAELRRRIGRAGGGGG